MTKFLQTLMDGVAVGSLYALIALGYTMVYGVLQFINFAHGDVFMLGVWFSFVAARAATTPDAFAQPLANEAAVVAGVAAGVCVAALLAQLALGRICTERPSRPLEIARGVARTGVYAGGGVAVTVGIVFLGSYAAYLVGGETGTGVVPALTVLVTAMLACGALGFTVERVAYRPLRNAPRLNVLITAIGVSLLLQNTGQLRTVFGTQPARMPTLLPDTTLFEFSGVAFRQVDAVVIGTTLVLMAMLQVLVYGSKTGLAMRAVSYDGKTAALMGIPVDRTISMTFVIGSVLAAAAGFLYAAKYPGLNQPAHPTWVLLGLKAFVAAVVGGIGNIRGAMLGGVLIGLIEFFGAAYLSPHLRDLYVFVILIAVLLVRPAGLLGRSTVEKV